MEFHVLPDIWVLHIRIMSMYVAVTMLAFKVLCDVRIKIQEQNLLSTF